MFRKKNGNVLKGSSEMTTLISEGTKLTGDLSFEGNLEILGSIIGNVYSQNEDARVRILHGGSVQGDVISALVVVDGHVSGDIYSSAHVRLSKQARLEGNTHYNLIEIEKGAEIAGSFIHRQCDTNADLPHQEQSDENDRVE
jgi:cytoskeletal protein CcmA (bactofilin family)